MADTGMQINWSARDAADIVASARRNLQTGYKAEKPAVPAAKLADNSRAGAPRLSDTVRLKKIRAIGGAAGKPGFYAAATLLLVSIGLAAVWNTNIAFAPEMYADHGMAPAAEAFAAGQNYAVFDLNLNIRRLRAEHVARFTETPEVVIFGASQWQEAHADLVRTRRMYDGHIHRDYWEDMLGVVEVYARNNRLPKQAIIAIRDNLFTPVSDRRDFLWEAGVDDYRDMADRLGIEKESYWATFPINRVKERLSLTMLFNNVTRWFGAKERPHATTISNFDSLDTLLPDGSILWSAQHRAIFTPQRAEREAIAFAGKRRNDPPKVDERGIEAFDKLLSFLKSNGTEVVLTHPPFNPIFYDRVKDGSYLAGLDNIRQITRKLAAAHGLKIIGDFDPARVGCDASMFIDAEHSNPACLAKVFAQFDALNEGRAGAATGAPR